MKQKIILASSSASRRKLMLQLDAPFEAISPNIDETPFANETAERLVLRLAEQKARALAVDYPNALIIGSDQVCISEGNIVGKPHTEENAIRQLMACRGRKIPFYTGLSLLNSHTNNAETLLDTTDVVFRNLTQAQVEQYVRRAQPLHCAGSFNAEGLGICLFEKIISTDPNTLIGLPMIQLVSLLRKQGFSIL